jgi:hypothetical protein
MEWNGEGQFCRTGNSAPEAIASLSHATLLFYGISHTNVAMSWLEQSSGAVLYDGETEHASSVYDTIAGRPW